MTTAELTTIFAGYATQKVDRFLKCVAENSSPGNDPIALLAAIEMQCGGAAFPASRIDEGRNIEQDRFVYSDTLNDIQQCLQKHIIQAARQRAQGYRDIDTARQCLQLVAMMLKSDELRESSEKVG